MKRVFQSVALLALLTATNARAHEDTILSVLPNGAIAGAPSQFGALFLTIDGVGTRNLRVSFMAGGRVTTLLPCAIALVNTSSVEGIQVSGSWYHDESTLPYYVNVRFLDPWRSPDPAERSSYSFTFNLRTGGLIDATRIVGAVGGYRTVPNPFAKDCKIATTEVRPNKSLERTRER
jgi:hypothetical protein